VRVEVLRWFVVLAEHEHLSEAALDLNISQPALSRAISQLEREVGVPLFDRRGRRLALNDNGARYLLAARRAVAELDGVERELRERWSAERGEIRLAFLHTLGEWMVPALIRDFRARFPDVSFLLSQAGAGRIADAVRAGRADLGIVGPRPEGELGWCELVREPIQLMVPVGHRLAGRRRVALRELASEPLVVLKASYGLRSLVDELIRVASIDPPIAFEGEDIGTLVGLVSAGLGVTLAPATLQASVRDDGVRVVAIRDAGAQRALGIIWDPSRTLPPAVAAYLDYVRSAGRAMAREAAASRVG
jgi:LysR family transcriptional activator of glutamate synthase operon